MKHPSLKEQARAMAIKLHAEELQENAEKMAALPAEARAYILDKINSLQPEFIQCFAAIGFHAVIVAMMELEEKEQTNEL